MPAAEPGLPIDDATVERLFERQAGLRRLALAVSGGADSLALLVLADRWRRLGSGRPELLVLTVDHGLRPESGAEARFVAEVASRFSVECRILVRDAPIPASGIEAAARSARYRLLVAAAREVGANQIATAHHRDDQAETLLMRLARGSGVYGLAGMAPSTDLGGVELVRPLLSLSHADLVATTKAAGLDAVDDPHNRDPRFSRSRMRALMPALAEEGLDPATLAATAARLRRASAAIDHYVGRLFASAAVTDAMGAIRLQAEAWSREPEEVRLRALARILRAAGGTGYVPRLDGLQALEASMIGAEAGERFQRTLSGVVVDRRKGAFRFQREAGRAGLPERSAAGRVDFIWDGRFHVLGEVSGEPVAVGALGGEGRRALAVCVEDALPRAIEALPALRRRGRILAVPALGVAPSSQDGIELSTVSIVENRLLDPARNDEP